MGLFTFKIFEALVYILKFLLRGILENYLSPFQASGYPGLYAEYATQSFFKIDELRHRFLNPGLFFILWIPDLGTQ